jgi:hypothetical protein
MRPREVAEAMEGRIRRDIARENLLSAYKQLPQTLLDSLVDVSELNAKYFRLVGETHANLSPSYHDFDRWNTCLRLALDFTPWPFKENTVPLKLALRMHSNALQDADALARAGSPEVIQRVDRETAAYLGHLARMALREFGIFGEANTDREGALAIVLERRLA